MRQSKGCCTTLLLEVQTHPLCPTGHLKTLGTIWSSRELENGEVKTLRITAPEPSICPHNLRASKGPDDVGAIIAQIGIQLSSATPGLIRDPLEDNCCVLLK